MIGNGYLTDLNGKEHCVINYFGAGQDTGSLNVQQPQDLQARVKAETERAKQLEAILQEMAANRDTAEPERAIYGIPFCPP
jgi:hypothetical protein